MAKEKLPRPPAWVMDVLISNLFEAGGKKAELALKISGYILEYQKKCTLAEAELIEKVQKVVNF